MDILRENYWAGLEELLCGISKRLSDRPVDVVDLGPGWLRR